MNQTQKRNLIGSIVCFFLSLLLGGIGIAIMMFREVKQAQDYHFDIEQDDIIRYSAIGAIGYACQICIIIYSLVKYLGS